MRRLAVALIYTAVALPATAEEIVEFPSATYRLSDFQKARGGEQKPGLAIPAYLSKPEGEGRHPAVVVLHGAVGWVSRTDRKPR